MSVKLVCPRCGAVTYKPSVETIVRQVEEAWKPWREYLTVEQIRMVDESLNIDRLKALLEKKGELKCFCPVCQLSTSIALYGLL